MSLRVRLAVAFAFVALITAVVVALAAPVIVGRGFAQIEAGEPGGPRLGGGPGPMAGAHAQRVQQETVITLVAVTVGAAAGASLIGILLAGRLAEPLGRLGAAASAVARGNLDQRSGLADRSDEIGSLGRSFDGMAAALEQAEASRRRFLQDAAHELKTPLAVIDATTTAVLDGVYSHEDRHLQTIRDQSRLLSRIVDDLRTISLAEAGELPLRVEPISIDRLVTEVAGAFASRADAAGLRLERDVAPGLWVRVDADRLRQVLAALLDNAVRHTPRGGRVVIEARSSGQRVRIGIRDGGPGVAPEDLPHLFERFYQADPARDRTTGTSGLGLSIVKAIIDAHGGSVGVERPAGGGACFWFELGVATGPNGPFSTGQ
ncbi:MAG: HAMP domain-containing sensor histidine kinase [Chloroflexota bacterium]